MGLVGLVDGSVDGRSVGGSVGSVLVGGLVGEFFFCSFEFFWRWLVFPVRGSGACRRLPVLWWLRLAECRSGDVGLWGSADVADMDSRRGGPRCGSWGSTARGWWRVGSTVAVGTMIAVVARISEILPSALFWVRHGRPCVF